MKRLLVALSVVAMYVVALPLGIQAQDKAKSMTASGTVKSVSGDSLVVTSSGKDMTFTMDGTTKFVGKGLSTKSTAKGGKLTATDAVAAGDMVSVTYHDMGGKMHAANVRITNKGTVKK
jgi:hypothetical protein